MKAVLNKIRSLALSLLPILLAVYGCYFTYRHFWSGFDLVSGDAGDARFNSMILEHTWLWVQGVHSSLFDLPMYYPHSNVYAYSDYLFGIAPIYWIFRLFGFETLLSFQSLCVTASILNFFSFFVIARWLFQFSRPLAALGAFIFAYSLPRITHLEHAQLTPQFFILMSAAGLWFCWKEPARKLGPLLFVLGAGAQFVTAYYFFWFWLWTVAVLLVYALLNRERRVALQSRFQHMDKKFAVLVSISGLAMVFPFLWHYLKAAQEVGMRDWPSISYGLPRFYSWILMPLNHWESDFLPMKALLESVPLPHEHYLSFGLMSWILVLLALFKVYRLPRFRYLTIPILTMLVLTFAVGRFSPWISIAYLFPGASAIRAVSRIHIFMLMFWSLIVITYLRESKKTRLVQIGVGILVLCFFIENTYTFDQVFSRSEDDTRVVEIVQKIPDDCTVLYYRGSGRLPAYVYQLDAVRAAFLSGRKTINGYSGNYPPGYGDILNDQDGGEGLVRWLSDHPSIENEKICQVSYLY